MLSIFQKPSAVFFGGGYLQAVVAVIFTTWLARQILKELEYSCPMHRLVIAPLVHCQAESSSKRCKAKRRKLLICNLQLVPSVSDISH